MSAPLLALQKINKCFGQHKVLEDLDLQIMAGQNLACLGPNGAGKTTLCLIMLGILQPDSGKVFWRGGELAKFSPAKKRAESRFIQAVFQTAYLSLDPRMEVESIVAEPLRNYKLGGHEQRRERVLTILRQVELEGENKKYPGQLSGGQRQRVALARALVPDPALLLLDEALLGLDAPLKETMVRLLRDYQARGGTLFMVTHEEWLAQELGCRILALPGRG